MVRQRWSFLRRQRAQSSSWSCKSPIVPWFLQQVMTPMGQSICHHGDDDMHTTKLVRVDTSVTRRIACLASWRCDWWLSDDTITWCGMHDTWYPGTWYHLVWVYLVFPATEYTRLRIGLYDCRLYAAISTVLVPVLPVYARDKQGGKTWAFLLCMHSGTCTCTNDNTPLWYCFRSRYRSRSYLHTGMPPVGRTFCWLVGNFKIGWRLQYGYSMYKCTEIKRRDERIGSIWCICVH